ncbi:tetratricopeptide repeat protein [Undibacterium baiyunense]|uniref:Tetratricopeptide repeat protein n=1 Tax=Undibacterium baiyunense TaxID=2828731 RepID=A0A941DGG0_9BURK|nr:tetratricopeptide repeat protein [Undibacterium baiyunense]MBR7747511.1 tetratricopeptide repeat protein [Undibacterium baiyunense]
MSLINQMLQELEKRGDAEDQQPIARYTQLGNHAPNSASNKTWFFVCFALVVVFVLVWFRDSLFLKSNVVSQKTSVPAPVVAASQASSPSASSNVPADTMARTAEVASEIQANAGQLGLSLKLSTQVNALPTASSSSSTLSNATSENAALEMGKRDQRAEASDMSNNGSRNAQQRASDPLLSKAPVAKTDEISSAESQKTLKTNTPNLANKSLTQVGGQASANNSPNSQTVMIKEVSAQQRAEGEYRQATVYQQQGRQNEALQALEAALKSDPLHSAARQLKISLLLEAKRHEDAIRELKQGLLVEPSQLNFSMILARLLVERAKLNDAIEVLQKNQGLAQDRPDYLAFLAALQQKTGHHKEAVQLYRQTLKKHSQNGVWWMGLGISLQADGMNQEAIEAFKQAKMQGGISAELQAFIEQKIEALQK